MNIKKNSMIFSIFFIFCIQFLLLINNRQKTSFRYFIWNVEEVSIGRLVFISFTSGLLISSFLNTTINNEFKINKKNTELNEIPPERDLRDTQPTISVNYRVIKDYGENENSNDKKTPTNSQYHDDWNNEEIDW